MNTGFFWWLWPFQSNVFNILFDLFFFWVLYNAVVSGYQIYDNYKKIKQYDQELAVLREKIKDTQAKIKEALRQYK